MKSLPLAGLAAALVCVSTAAFAQTAPPGDTVRPEEPRDIKSEVPVVGYTVSAFGASRMTIGAAAFAGLNGSVGGVDSTQVGGGGRIWGSPVDRLTLILEVNRSYYNKPTPTATVLVRIAGDRARGWAFAASATYKADPFAAQEDERGGEVELSALFSVAQNRWHLDANVVGGTGLNDEGELDAELKLRAGYDVASWMRIGVDGRGRYRLSGKDLLPGGHLGDFIGGPEVLFGIKNFFFGLGTGPSTVGVANGWGWAAQGTFGGALL